MSTGRKMYIQHVYYTLTYFSVISTHIVHFFACELHIYAHEVQNGDHDILDATQITSDLFQLNQPNLKQNIVNKQTNKRCCGIVD